MKGAFPSRGFSLVELLVVVAVMALLLVVATPAFTNISQGMSLSRGGQDLANAIVLARQEAATRNRRAFVRIFALPDSGGELAYRAVQPWIVKDDAGTLTPLGRLSAFPEGVVLAEDASLSPLLQSPPSSNGTASVAGTTRNYREFAILANGSLEGISDTNSFLTVVREKDAGGTASSAPANFFAIFLNSVTGEVSTFQP